MTLAQIELDFESVAIPRDIRQFLRAVDHRVEKHRVNTATSFRGFVPSDYTSVYRCLKAVYDSNLLCGDRFCEWGSGIGVVASMASAIGYEAYGIECNHELCLVAEELSEEFELGATLINGSFVPPGVEDLIDHAFTSNEGDVALYMESDDAYDEMALEVNDFDLIFVYPWPNDVELTHRIFDRCAASGALLLAYYEHNSISLFRKSGTG